ncbi:hypothetical protein LSCM4_00492 [Leishmania orientalis]|uniref:Uncharacterized protein n=1 Tax=Leishmania orientalis TaxID=2249476 RepID=A0A836GUK7_9TRYP|nr:hypothetical protein LSCM4_00492 [Leishmania orientalis]
MTHDLAQEAVPAAAKRLCKFSVGLQFTSKDVNGPCACPVVVGRRGVSDGEAQAAGRAAVGTETCGLASEGEGLLWKAFSLRRRIETGLVPRQEEAECALRHGRRQLAELQRLLPSVAFLHFRQKCAAWYDLLHLFEELVVHGLLKDAVDSALRSGELTEPSRWRKSNQWPAISNLLQLQLHLCCTVGGITAGGEASPNRMSGETCAVFRHLAALWAERQARLFTGDFLDCYYTLRDVLHGWGSGWCARVLCVDGAENSSSSVSCRVPQRVPGPRFCSFPAWDSLSAVDRLTSYSTVCPHHLTEDVVQSLELLVVTHFADVWRSIELVVGSAST